jgi:hypothetical protein
LAIKRVTAEDAGDYKVDLWNPYGSASASASRTAKFAPRFDPKCPMLSGPRTISSKKRQSFILAIDYVASAPARVIWALNGVQLVDRLIEYGPGWLRLRVANCSRARDACTYTCMVENDVGTDSVGVRVDVYTRPGSPEDVKVTSTLFLLLGDHLPMTAELNCTVTSLNDAMSLLALGRGLVLEQRLQSTSLLLEICRRQ